MYTSWVVPGVLKVILVKINEHALKDKNSVMYNYINNCDGVSSKVSSWLVQQVQTDYDKFDKIYSIAIVKENISIVDRARRWDILLFKEALHIKEKNSALDGLKTSNELKLF